jgi:hypothetical protein
LPDNANIAGISVNRMNVTGREGIITKAREAYHAYNEKIWMQAYFDEYSGGFNVYHKDHQFAKKRAEVPQKRKMKMEKWRIFYLRIIH